MGRLFETVRGLNAGIEKIKKRSYGCIEVTNGQLTGIHLRPWPKLVSGMESWWDSSWGQNRQKKDRCLIYYNQPISHRNYLAFSYILTAIHTTYPTWTAALAALDFVAYAKRSDAILAEIYNKRISDRLLIRLGWEQQNLNSRKRHWIKRFYGEYPEHPVFKRMGLIHPIPNAKAIVAGAFPATKHARIPEPTDSMAPRAPIGNPLGVPIAPHANQNASNSQSLS